MPDALSDASQISSPRATRIPRSPVRQTFCNNTSRSRVERHPRSNACVSKKTCADLRPSSCSREKNAHSALSLEDAPSPVNISLAMRWIRMPAHCAPSLLPGLATCLRVRFKTSSRITELSQHEANGREFQEREGV